MDLRIFKHSSPETAQERLSIIMGYPSLGIDIETTGLDPYLNQMVTIQIANGVNDEVDVIDLRGNNFSDVFNTLSQYEGRIYFHNAAFDLRFLFNRYGSLLYADIFDTYLAELVCAGGRKWGFGLDAVATRRLGISLDKSIRDEFLLPMFNIMEVSETQAQYGAMDAWVLPRIGELQCKDLYETGQMRIADLEFDVIPAIVLTSLRGFTLDIEAWTKIYEEAQNQAEDSMATLAEIVGNRYFNPNSDREVIAAMKQLGIKVPIFHEKETSREEFISKIGHPFIKHLLVYRENAKKASTYGKEFLNNVHPITGRIHSDFRQLGTDTGRFTSSKPNMQQIPKEPKFRGCFIAPESYSIISADFSSQEMAIMAEASKEPALIKAFHENQDLHRAAAGNIFGVDYNQVSDEQRKVGKTLNFGLAYGSSAWNMANKLDISEARAQKLVDDYWKKYPELAKWQRRAGLLAWNRGYSETFWGRRRYYEGFEKNQVMRMGANHAISGTAADMTKLAIVDIEKRLREYREKQGLDACMVNFVHDEIETEVKSCCAEMIAKEVQWAMEYAGSELVSVVAQRADVKIGGHWQ